MAVPSIPTAGGMMVRMVLQHVNMDSTATQHRHRIFNGAQLNGAVAVA